jgi:thioesterase domain-containing protein
MNAWTDDEIASVITDAWTAVAGREPANGRTNFFEAGNTSLQAALLMVKLQERFGDRVSLQAVFEHPTVDALVSVVRAGPGSVSYLTVLRDGPGVPVVLCPDFGGGPAYLEKLADDELDRPVLSITSRGARGEAAPYETMHEIAAHLLATLTGAGVTGPVHLLANCLGGLGALAAAQSAPRVGLSLRSVLLLNTSPLPIPPLSRRAMVKVRLQEVRGFASLLPDPAIDAAPDEVGEDELIDRTFADVLGTGALQEKTIEAFRTRFLLFIASWTAASQFRHRPIAVPLCLMYSPDYLTEPDEVDGWSRVGYEPLAVQNHPGLRTSGIGERHNIGIIARHLRDCDATAEPLRGGPR